MPSLKGLKCDARKLRGQMIGALYHSRHHCVGPYPHVVLLSGGSQWDLAVNAAEQSSFAAPAVLADRRYLACYFNFLLQEVVPDVASFQY